MKVSQSLCGKLGADPRARAYAWHASVVFAIACANTTLGAWLPAHQKSSQLLKKTRTLATIRNLDEAGRFCRTATTRMPTKTMHGHQALFKTAKNIEQVLKQSNGKKTRALTIAVLCLSNQ